MDSYEKLFIDKFGIAAYGMAEIDRLGIGNVMSLALNRIDPDRNKSIHVSFDIDALDPLEAPSTGTAGKFIKLRNVPNIFSSQMTF